MSSSARSQIKSVGLNPFLYLLLGAGDLSHALAVCFTETIRGLPMIMRTFGPGS